MSNAMPGPSSLAYSPKNSPLTINEKTIARNVYKFVSETMAGWAYAMEIVEKTAEIMGVSVNTIRRVITEHRDTGNVSSPVLQVPRLSAVNQLDDFVLTGIKRKIHQFYFDKEIPKVKKILAAINNDEDLPTFKRTTFLKVLKKLNFTYCKRSRKSILLDRPDLMIWRRKYLLKMADYRREDRKIYYLDETWVNEGHSVSSVWVDNEIETSRQAFMRGLSTGLKNPNKGRRLIVTHIGSEDGFLEGGEWVFEAKKSDGDCHGEMDAHNFEKWFSQMLTKMEPGSVVVMDNASYHSRQVDRQHNLSRRKNDIRTWLREKNIDYQENEIKAQLLAKIEKNRYNIKYVDQMALEKGIEVLRLPPYHCELNPIELIWAQVKSHVGRHNKTFKMAEVKDLLKEGMRKIGATEWSNCINHVKKCENKMMQLDGLIDTMTDGRTEKFLIDVGSGSDGFASDSEPDFEDDE